MTQNLEAERSVLGGIFLDNQALDQVAPLIKSADFQTLQNQRVYSSMLELAQSGIPIDPVSMASSLAHRGALKRLGGIDYLLGLAGSTASIVNIEHHARMVQSAAQVRDLAQLCQDTLRRIQKHDYEDAGQLLSETGAALERLHDSDLDKGFVQTKEGLKEAVDRAQAAYESGSCITGLPSGFSSLDALTAGFQPADLITLAARPSMGKTALVLNLALKGLQETKGAHSVAFFSLEMPHVQLWTRLLSGEANVAGDLLKTGALGMEQIMRINQAVARLAQLPLFVDDTAGISVMELRAKARRLHRDPSCPPLGLIVVDYLQLMSSTARSREQEISSISRGLKSLAKELQVPIIALSQLNRSLESRSNKRPIMSDLRESGAIEQDADLILFIYRDEIYNEESESRGTAELIIAKHRNGGLGTIKLSFAPPISSFGETRS